MTMTAVERAANRLHARLNWPQAEACAADIADLLVTDEIQAVLDGLGDWWTNPEMRQMYLADLASRAT